MLLWFRNDLRTHDNPALHFLLANRSNKKQSKAIFFVSEEQWIKHDWSDIKIDFVMRHANALVTELKQLGIELQLVTVPDFNAQVSYLVDYCKKHEITTVVASSEVELNESLRDRSCIEQGVPLKLFESDVIVSKGKLLNKAGLMYKVFTPFKNAWVEYVKNNGFQYLGREVGECALEKEQKGPSRKWPLASEFEQMELANFLSHKVVHYASKRDFPSVKATSGLSPYLALGIVSPRYILQLLISKYPDILYAKDSTEFVWLNEIIWREFYRHVVFHNPTLCKHQSFNPKYQHTKWLEQDENFKAWCSGHTGYPIVDAAMRQLNKTGWMHNRLRMVVASFLSKHLLIDWRKGERYFMQKLIDGDFSSNNGGWQWAASTGCDAQPYFRIFNPIRQSERFDPNGIFIRKYIPELRDVPDKDIHFPHSYIDKHNLNIYWPAIVEHKVARQRALAFYQ